jgi:hypothetical protein
MEFVLKSESVEEMVAAISKLRDGGSLGSGFLQIDTRRVGGLPALGLGRNDTVALIKWHQPAHVPACPACSHTLTRMIDLQLLLDLDNLPELREVYDLPTDVLGRHRAALLEALRLERLKRKSEMESIKREFASLGGAGKL